MCGACTETRLMMLLFVFMGVWIDLLAAVILKIHRDYRQEMSANLAYFDTALQAARRDQDKCVRQLGLMLRCAITTGRIKPKNPAPR